jgi:hypothetical protein
MRTILGVGSGGYNRAATSGGHACAGAKANVLSLDSTWNKEPFTGVTAQHRLLEDVRLLRLQAVSLWTSAFLPSPITLQKISGLSPQCTCGSVIGLTARLLTLLKPRSDSAYHLPAAKELDRRLSPVSGSSACMKRENYAGSMPTHSSSEGSPTQRRTAGIKGAFGPRFSLSSLALPARLALIPTFFPVNTLSSIPPVTMVGFTSIVLALGALAARVAADHSISVVNNCGYGTPMMNGQQWEFPNVTMSRARQNVHA